MRSNKVNVLKKMLGMIMVAPVALSLSLFAADPVHLWELDENVTDGTTYADFYNEANGTCTGVHCPTPSVGQINGAQDFNATEFDRIDITNTTNFDWAQDANITITFWMMSEVSPEGNKIMIGRTHSGGILWYIGVDGDQSPGNIRVAVALDKNDLSVYDRDSGSDENVTDGAWHHIAVVLTEPEIKVYVDGEFDFNVTRTPASDLIVGSDVNIGSVNLPGLEFPYDGNLDDIALYNAALSADEIKQNYDSIVSPPAPEPEPEPTEPDTTVTTTSGGGGCTYNPDSKNFDMMFLLMIALGLFYPFRRRFIKQSSL